jgi:hypothetical protein
MIDGNATFFCLFDTKTSNVCEKNKGDIRKKKTGGRYSENRREIFRSVWVKYAASWKFWQSNAHNARWLYIR